MRGRKRHNSWSRHSESHIKVRRTDKESRRSPIENPQRLPSPFSTKRLSFETATEVHQTPINCERGAPLNHLADTGGAEISEGNQTPSVSEWLSNLPENITDMDPPPSKRSRSQSLPRSRSSDSRGRGVSESGDGTGSTVSRDTKYSAYKDVNYVVVLETKHCYMRPSAAGPIEEDRQFCQRLLHEDQPIPQNTMLHEDWFEEFQGALQGRSEARVYLDLHPLLVPTAEHLQIRHEMDLGSLIDGYNDPWVKAIPIYGPRPQPDHFVGFRWQVFSEEERRKLGVEPSEKSYFTAREDIYFPFLACEIKCGSQALELANRANAHSMAIAVRGIVELYRKAGSMVSIHRRILGFSISHDDQTARIYGHYPEIEDEQATFYRYEIARFHIKGTERWSCQRFVRNLYAQFPALQLKRIKDVLNHLIDPAESFESVAVGDEDDSQSSVISIPTSVRSQAAGARTVEQRRPRGLNAELRSMIQSLQQQLEQQRQETKQQLEQQAQREEKLLTQLEQQRQEAKQQLEQQVQREEKQRQEAKQQLEQQALREEKQRQEAKQQLEQQAQREEKLLTQLEQQAQREEKLLTQLELQRQEAKQQLEQQREEAKQREERLLAQVEEQRRETIQLLSRQR